jgi:pilus assembly protein Flp/PilA
MAQHAGNRNSEGGIMNKLFQFIKDEDGASMVEYALLLALIAVVAITILTTMGSNVSSIFKTISDSLTAAAS